MTDIQKLKALTEAAIAADKPGVCVAKLGDAWSSFEDAANPATVLELIARIEEQDRAIAKLVDQCLPVEELKDMPGYSRVLTAEVLVVERDQLKAENEAIKAQIPGWTKREIELIADCELLRRDAERWRFVRNPIGNGSPFAIWSERTNLFSGPLRTPPLMMR